MLKNIINYGVGSFLLVGSAIIFAMILLKEEPKILTKKKFILFIICVILYGLVIYYLNDTTKTLMIFIIYSFLFVNLFKITYYKSTFMTFLFIVIAMIPDALFLLFCISVLKMKPEVFYAEFTNNIISTSIICVLLLLIVCVFRRPLRKLTNLKITNKSIIIYGILTLMSVLIVFYNAMSEIILSKNALSNFALISIFILVFSSFIKQKLENNVMVEKYDKLLEFVKVYEAEIEEQKEIRHENKNQLILLKSYVVDDYGKERIVNYIDSVINDYRSCDKEKYANFQYLPSNGLKGLFYYKAMEAEDKGIKLSIAVASRIGNSFIKNLSVEDFKQLGRIVGVYLDNAIEASATSDEKKMGIEIFQKEDGNCIEIIIMNTYSGVIDKEAIGNIRYSTKGKGHGYGLMMVKRILQNSDIFFAKTIIEDKLYIQKLQIRNSIQEKE